MSVLQKESSPFEGGEDVNEMKSEKRRLTENQQWFLTNAESVGYKTVVCYGSKEAIAAIQAYYEQQKV